MIDQDNYLDSEIGNKIRSRRKLLSFSSKHFASLLGISYQQLYKYESGENRVSATQLAKMAKILNVPIDYFLQPECVPIHNYVNDSFRAGEIANEPETHTLLKNYVAISDVRVRMAVGELVASINKYFRKRAS